MDTPLTDFSQPTPFLVEYLQNIVHGKALDIGTGTGRNAVYLAKEGFEVTALDTDKEALNALRKIADYESFAIKIISKDIRSFESTDKYDLIVCLMVMHFLDAEEIKSVISWMKNHTNIGGVNIVSAFTDSNPVGTRLFKNNELEEYYADWNIQTSEYKDSSILENEVLTSYSVVRLAAIYSD